MRRFFTAVASTLLAVLVLAGTAGAIPPGVRIQGNQCPDWLHHRSMFCNQLLYAPLTTDLYYNGRKSATFTRGSARVFEDWEGNYVRTTNTNEAVFKARRVANLLAADSSEDFSVASWVKTTTTSVTGTNVLNFPDANTYIYQSLSTTVSPMGRTFVFPVVLSGSGTITIGIFRYGGTGIFTKTVTLTSTPTRYSVTAEFPSDVAAAGYQVRLTRGSADTATQVTATDAMLEEVTGQSNQNPSEYTSTHQYYGGQTVKGVQYLDYENGNTVDANGVVTEAQVAAIPAADLHGILYDGTATNKLAGAFNAVGPDMLGSELASGTLAVGKRYQITARTDADFTADGAADNVVGTQFTATDTTVTLDAGDKVKEIGAANLAGTFQTGLGAGAKNTAAATAAIPGMAVSGDAAGVLSIVSDAAALATAKLTRLIPSGKVYKADNSTGVADMIIDMAGNLSAATHTISLFARGDSAADDDIQLGDATTGVGAAIDLTDDYALKSYTYTAAAAATRIIVPAGDTVYFTLMQSAALTVADSRIIVEGAAASRSRDALTIPVADGVNFRQREGTASVDITWGFGSASIPVSGSFSILQNNTTANVLYIINSAGNNLLYSYDGTSSASRAISAFQVSEADALKVTWSRSKNKLHNYSLVNGWGTVAEYDGQFTISTSWIIGNNSAYPFALKNLRVLGTADPGGM